MNVMLINRVRTVYATTKNKAAILVTVKAQRFTEESVKTKVSNSNLKIHCYSIKDCWLFEKELLLNEHISIF